MSIPTKIRILIVVFITTGCVMAETGILPAFSTGEVTDLLAGRTDVKQWHGSARVCENFRVAPQGGVTKRNGTYYIATAPGIARLVPFQYSTSQAYVLELSDTTMRFYK